MKKIFFGFLAAMLLFSASVAQAAPTADDEIDARTLVVGSIGYGIDYTAISKELNSISDALKAEHPDNSAISKYVSYLGDTRGRLSDDRKQIENELKNTNKRIEMLGEAPQNGSEEPPLIAQKRKEYNDEAVYQKSRIAEADILINKTDDLVSQISELRKQILIGNLLVYQSPLIYPVNFLSATGEFIDFCFDIVKSPLGWYQQLTDAQILTIKSHIFGAVLLIFAVLTIGIFLRLLIIRRLGYNKNADNVPYFSKVVTAFFVACAYGIIPAMMLGGILLWVIQSQVLTVGFFGLVLASALYYFLYIFLAGGAVRVVLTPHNPQWRLLHIGDKKAKALTSDFYFSFFVIGIFSMLQHIAEDADYSLELIYFISFVLSTLKASFLVLVIKDIFWDEETAGNDGDTVDEAADNKARAALRTIFLSVIFAFAVIGISLFGYPRLAAYIINRFLFSVLIVGAFIIVRQALFELIKRILLLTFWTKTLRVRHQLIEKIDFWINITLNPIFVILAVLILLSLWGVSTDILLQSVKKIFLGFQIGGVEISLLSILLGIAVFFISITLVRIARRKLFDNVLQHMEIEDGIRHSLASGFGFVGYLLATVIAIAVMGGDLSNIALVAGALSVGIGLGLQNIVNNFVSGIILLFERPIKVGDWVIIGGEEGRIKQINIRSTEVETFKKSSVIIPNATLLSSSVTNLTHGNNWSRQSLTVGVAYGTDPVKVTNVLLECAKAHKRVLKNPAPYVLFKDFGDSSLVFELRCYTNDIWTGWNITSDLRYEIDRRFKEEGIEIPFPQMVVHRGGEISEIAQQQFYGKSNNGENNANK